LVVHYGAHPSYAAWGVAGGVMEHGLQVGDLGSVGALTRYTRGVARQEERVGSRQWGQYGDNRATGLERYAAQVQRAQRVANTGVALANAWNDGLITLAQIKDPESGGLWRRSWGCESPKLARP
jgi:hypothetical protein